MPYNNGGTTLYFGPWYRRSPFFEATRRAGAKAYDIYNHMYLPGLYTDPVEEYWHLRNHVTLWDVSVERQVEIRGRDGFKFANYLTPRDLTKCEVGQGKYVVITDDDGGVINDPVLIRLEKDRFWLSLANSDTLLWAKGVAVNAGMDVEVTEPDVSPVQIQGPKSRDVVRALFGKKILGLPYYSFLEAKVDGIPVVVTRTGWSAELGYEIYLCDGGRGLDLWDRIMAAGRPHGVRHHLGGQPVRGRPGMARRPRQEGGLRRQEGTATDQEGGGEAEARRGRDPWTADRLLAPGVLARPPRRQVGGGAHRAHALPAAREEHRVRDGPRKAVEARHADHRHHPRGRTSGDCCASAVRGPCEGNPEDLGR